MDESTYKQEELNNWIGQQINCKEENKLSNYSAVAHVANMRQQIKLFEIAITTFEKGVELRNDQDALIDADLKRYKQSIRSGAYGDEHKEMEFIDEKK